MNLNQQLHPLKRLLYLYQKTMWYFQVFVSEARKPLVFVNETLLILTFLAVKKIDVNALEAVFFYILIVAIGSIIGKILTNWGIVSYITRINNAQNPEIIKILSELKEIKEKLK